MPAVLVRAPSKAQALKLMHDRHENMEQIGKAFKIAGRELKASAPNLATVRSSAATIAGFAPKVPSWFPPGTGPDVGKTMAKPEVWQKPADFAAKAKAFRERRWRSTQPRKPATSPPSRPASATSPRPARRATTAIATSIRSDALVKAPVWDLPVRLFHWLLTGLIGFSWWSVKFHHTDWHIWSGIAILTLLVFRLLWGFSAARPPVSPISCAAPARCAPICATGSWRVAGHTPLGALSIVAMLGAVAVQVGLGSSHRPGRPQ